eukprot:GHVP01031161.1.p1 GENE.GHVP01031161.1~~GHVP01031161.1.p1  ORF type:complete len:226 (+),score=52.69 GHVP01031161.1:953-1630(+)
MEIINELSEKLAALTKEKGLEMPFGHPPMEVLTTESDVFGFGKNLKSWWSIIYLSKMGKNSSARFLSRQNSCQMEPCLDELSNYQESEENWNEEKKKDVKYNFQKKSEQITEEDYKILDLEKQLQNNKFIKNYPDIKNKPNWRIPTTFRIYQVGESIWISWHACGGGSCPMGKKKSNCYIGIEFQFNFDAIVTDFVHLLCATGGGEWLSVEEKKLFELDYFFSKN